MEIFVILSAIILLAPLTLTILKSLNLLGTQASNYYDFHVIFRNTKPWTIALYISIIAILSFVILLLFGLPFVTGSA